MTYRNHIRYQDWWPAIMIASAWVALWLLWPAGELVAPRRPRARPVQIRYLRQDHGGAANPSFAPMLIALPTTAGAEPVPEDRPSLGALVADRSIGVQLMAYTGTSNFLRAAAEDPAGDRMPALGRIGVSAPAAGSARALAVRSGGAAKAVVVEVAGELARYGFEPGKIVEEAVARNASCTVAAHVDADEKGRIRHVFIETPCEDPEVNALCIRALRQGSVLKPGTAVSGTVTLTFRSRKPTPIAAP